MVGCSNPLDPRINGCAGDRAIDCAADVLGCRVYDSYYTWLEAAKCLDRM